MKRYLPILISALVLTGCGTSGTSQAEESFIAGSGAVTTIKEGSRQKAPAISGMTLSGENYSFAGGQVAVVNVWASWCSPCRAEAPALQELSVAHPEVQFLGVLTRDSLVAARAFVERFEIKYPSLVDDSILLKFHGQLTPNAIPTTLIIDSSGNVAARISGEVTYSALEDLIERVKSNE